MGDYLDIADTDIISEHQLQITIASSENAENEIHFFGSANSLVTAPRGIVKYIEITDVIGKGEYEEYGRAVNTRLFFSPGSGGGIMMRDSTDYVSSVWLLTLKNIPGVVRAEDDTSTFAIEWDTHNILHVPYNTKGTIVSFNGSINLIGKDAEGDIVGYNVTPKG